MFCPHEGHHTRDQLGTDHVQLSLRTNGPSGNCLFPPPSPLTPPLCLPPSLSSYPQCVYLTLRAKKHFECFYRFGHRTRIVVFGDSFLEIGWRRLKCLWIDGVLFYGFHMEGIGHLSLFLYFLNLFKLFTTLRPLCYRYRQNKLMENYMYI